MLFLLLLVVAPLCFAYVVAGILARVYQPLSDVWNLLRLVFFVGAGCGELSGGHLLAALETDL